MKKITLIPASLLFVFSLHAQIEEGVIFYQTEIINQSRDWAGSLKKSANDSTSFEGEDSLKNEVVERIAKFLEKKSRPDTIIFHFNKKYARTIRPNIYEKNKMRIYEIAPLIERIYSVDHGIIKYDSIIWDYRTNPDWEVSYEVTEDKNDRKNILGYDCFKVEVFEDRVANGNPYQMKYDLYVNDEIVFPPHLICGWYDHVLDYCVFEMDARDMRMPEAATISRVVKIEEGVNGEMFDPKTLIKD